MSDWIFAFIHFGLFIGVIIYAVYYLIQGNISRFFILFVCLTIYYFLVLHKGVKQEIQRRKQGKS